METEFNCGQNTKALKNKQTFPSGNVDRLTCCRLLKSEALKNSLLGEWARYKFDHTIDQFDIDEAEKNILGLLSVLAPTKKEAVQKKDIFLLVIKTAIGMLEISRRNYGINLKQILHQMNILEFILCSTGLN